MFFYIITLLPIFSLLLFLNFGITDVNFLVFMFSFIFIYFLNFEKEMERENSFFNEKELFQKIIWFFQEYGIERYVQSLFWLFIFSLITIPIIFIFNLNSWFFIISINFLSIVFNLLYKEWIPLFLFPWINDISPESYNFFNFFKNIGKIVWIEIVEKIKIFDIWMEKDSLFEKILFYLFSLWLIAIFIFNFFNFLDFIKNISFFSSNILVIIGSVFSISVFFNKLFVWERALFQPVITNIKESNFNFSEWDWSPFLQLWDLTNILMIIFTIVFILNAIFNVNGYLESIMSIFNIYDYLKELFSNFTIKEIFEKLFNYYKLI